METFLKIIRLLSRQLSLSPQEYQKIVGGASASLARKIAAAEKEAAEKRGRGGGGAERQSSQSGFSSKKVRILTKRHRQT